MGHMLPCNLGRACSLGRGCSWDYCHPRSSCQCAVIKWLGDAPSASLTPLFTIYVLQKNASHFISLYTFHLLSRERSKVFNDLVKFSVTVSEVKGGRKMLGHDR